MASAALLTPQRIAQFLGLIEPLGLDGAFAFGYADGVWRADPWENSVFFGPSSAEELEFALAGIPPEAEVWSAAQEVIDFGRPAELRFDEVLIVKRIETPHRYGVTGLADVVRRLLEPESGCPWDLEQTHSTLKKHLIEEAYELIEAIDAEDEPDMVEELGDVLLQPLMHAEMMRRRGSADIESIAQRTSEKLVRRHPHVFGESSAKDAEAVLKQWDAIKKSEKTEDANSLLQGIPKSLPSLIRAMTISKRAARAGFEWPNADAVMEKFDEERAELREALESNDRDQIESELGDVLFTVVNLARWQGIDAEESLRKMLDRFTARFQAMERMASVPLEDLDPEAWDNLWNQAKVLVGTDQPKRR